MAARAGSALAERAARLPGELRRPPLVAACGEQRRGLLELGSSGGVPRRFVCGIVRRLPARLDGAAGRMGQPSGARAVDDGRDLRGRACGGVPAGLTGRRVESSRRSFAFRRPTASPLLQGPRGHRLGGDARRRAGRCCACQGGRLRRRHPAKPEAAGPPTQPGIPAGVDPRTTGAGPGQLEQGRLGRLPGWSPCPSGAR